jgi:diguanylate cyclase (GGDEF)-like protein
VVARIGGEEFAIMLPETTDAAAVQFAERLRRQLREHAPMLESGKLPVTISVGVAAATATTPGVDALMRCADEALYQAKRSGRDRVCVWRPPMLTPVTEAAE